jgi:carbon-monoxide dehydrogenase medium subunit
MKMPPFGYERARDLSHLFEIWGRAGDDAKVLAGGQSLLATLAFRLSEPSLLIDISRLQELKGVSLHGDVLRIGAGVSHAQLGAHPLVGDHAPLLTQAVPLIAHPAIRNRGTIGGSLAFADPAAELPACAVALGATLVLASAKGERRIAAQDFFKGYYETALGAREIILAVEIPRAASSSVFGIQEIARRSGDYAMAGLAFSSPRDEQGRLLDPRLVYFGVGSGPVVARGAMAALAGRAPDGASIAAAQAALAGDLDPPVDMHGGPELKRHLSRVLLARVLAPFGPAAMEAAE